MSTSTTTTSSPLSDGGGSSSFFVGLPITIVLPVAGAILLVLIVCIVLGWRLYKRRRGRRRPRMDGDVPSNFLPMVQISSKKDSLDLYASAHLNGVVAPPDTVASLLAFIEAAPQSYRILERVKLMKMENIGSGKFTLVHRGLYQEFAAQHPAPEVALKELQKDSPEDAHVRLLKEACLMGQLGHPNVLRLVGLELSSSLPILVSEYASLGPLDRHLRQTRPGTDVHVSMAVDVARGMQYLTLCNFVVKDLQARRVLVMRDRSCKIASFGLSVDASQAIPWLAPELYPSEENSVVRRLSLDSNVVTFDDPPAFTQASDSWRLGVVLYEIFSNGDRPYGKWRNNQIMQEVRTGHRLAAPPGCPLHVYRLMIRAWHPDPSQREYVSHFPSAILADNTSSPPPSSDPILMGQPSHSSSFGKNKNNSNNHGGHKVQRGGDVYLPADDENENIESELVDLIDASLQFEDLQNTYCCSSGSRSPQPTRSAPSPLIPHSLSVNSSGSPRSRSPNDLLPPGSEGLLIPETEPEVELRFPRHTSFASNTQKFGTFPRLELARPLSERIETRPRSLVAYPDGGYISILSSNFIEEIRQQKLENEAESTRKTALGLAMEGVNPRTDAYVIEHHALDDPPRQLDDEWVADRESNVDPPPGHIPFHRHDVLSDGQPLFDKRHVKEATHSSLHQAPPKRRLSIFRSLFKEKKNKSIRSRTHAPPPSPSPADEFEVKSSSLPRSESFSESVELHTRELPSVPTRLSPNRSHKERKKSDPSMSSTAPEDVPPGFYPQGL